MDKAVAPSDALVESLLSFWSQRGYLHYPEVTRHGTDNGDTEEAWCKRFMALAAYLHSDTERRALKGQA